MAVEGKGRVLGLIGHAHPAAPALFENPVVEMAMPIIALPIRES